MSCPEAIGVRSTSIGGPAAIVDASGFIGETSGQSVATPPTAAAHPVATKRKSRRVGCSAADAVVTITPLSKLQPVEPPQATHKRTKGGCRRPRPPRPQKNRFSRPIGRNKQSRIGLLAPFPEKRKPGIGCPACKALIPRRALNYSEISWGN